MKGFVAAECGEEFGWELAWPVGEVGPEGEAGLIAEVGVGSGLHALVDEKDLSAGVAGGKERGAKGHTIDGTGDAATEHVRPGGCGVKGDAGDGPFEAGMVGLEVGAEGLGFWGIWRARE